MKIQGVPFGNNGINSIKGKNPSKVSTQNDLKKSDSVEISGRVAGKDIVERLSHGFETEFQPRVELMEAVSRRISSSTYSAPEVLENIAESIINSKIVPDVAESIPMDQVRIEKVEEAGGNVEQSYYDNPDVVYEIAARILSLVVPASLLGNTSVN